MQRRALSRMNRIVEDTDPSTPSSPTAPSGAANRLRWRPLLVAFCIALSTIAVYWPVGSYHFINFDDPLYVSENPHIAGGLSPGVVGWAFTSNYAGNWHPLTWLSHALDVSLFGLDPGAHHLSNVLHHAGAAFVLMMALHASTQSLFRSGLVALLFALHPLHVESVAWISERKDTLSTLFAFATIWAYADFARDRRLIRYVLVLTCYALSLLAKPMGVTLPIVLLMLDVWPLQRHRVLPARRLLLEKLPLLALAGLISAITLWAQSAGGAVAEVTTVPIHWRVINAALAACAYLIQTVWPTKLSMFYPHPAVLGEAIPWMRTSLAVGFLVLVTAWAIKRRNQCPYLLIGWLWFAVTLLPVIGLIQVGSQGRADRYTYIPLVGIFIAAVWYARDKAKTWNIPTGMRMFLAAVVVVACAISTRSQLVYWRDSETLFTHAIDVTPKSYLARNQLGLALIEVNQLKRAAQEFALSVDINPTYALGHNNLAIALQKMGDMPGALEHYDKALQIDPGYIDAMINLGSLLASVGQQRAAVPYFAKVVELRPDDPSAHYDLGQQLAAAGAMEEAIEQFEITLRLDPSHPQASESLAQARAFFDNFRREPSTVMMTTSKPATQATTRAPITTTTSPVP